MYKIIGYYICEIVTVPNWIGVRSTKMLSVSNCFEAVHPDLTSCFFKNKFSRQLSKEYATKLSWKEEKLEEIKSDIANLFQKGLAIDGRFLRLTDAKYFYQTYFAETNSIIVSVSTTEEFYDILCRQLVDNNAIDKDNIIPEEDNGGELIGCDILGWDISRFHSFLCNHLQEELPNARFNDYALLDNEFNEVIEFAQSLQGKGEPVEWIPCRIAME